MARIETQETISTIVESFYGEGKAAGHLVDQLEATIQDTKLDMEHYQGFNRYWQTLMLVFPDMSMAVACTQKTYEAFGFHGDIDPRVKF